MRTLAYNCDVTAPTEDALLASLEPPARARMEALLQRRWSLPGEHPLARLHGARMALRDASAPSRTSGSEGPQDDRYHLIALLGPKNNVGSRYFQLFVVDNDGRLSEDPLALGLHSTGRFPAFNWIELTQYRAVLRIGGETLDLPTTRLDRALFNLLAQFVPPGGHIMVEYDSPTQRASERILTLGYPPVCSPLGHLMFRIGCRSYRDWYISEGGREGPRKLQGFMPLNEEIKGEKTSLLRDQLERFLSRSTAQDHGQWGVRARRNAQAVVQALSVA